jgi:hypothetical protein
MCERCSSSRVTGVAALAHIEPSCVAMAEGVWAQALRACLEAFKAPHRSIAPMAFVGRPVKTRFFEIIISVHCTTLISYS